jgi:hypothetical protein
MTAAVKFKKKYIEKERERERGRESYILPALLSFRIRAASVEGNTMRKTMESRQRTQSKERALIVKLT